MKAMKEELGNSGYSEDEILQKTKALMKALGKKDEDSDMLDLTLVSKQQNSALKKCEISPKDYAKVGQNFWLNYLKEIFHMNPDVILIHHDKDE